MPTSRRDKRIVQLTGDDWYTRPAWYDILHSAGTAREVDQLERTALRWCACDWRGNMRWLEPACGSGRYLRTAAGRGIRVFGFDAEPAMIAYAQSRLTGAGLTRNHARVWVDRMESFAPLRNRERAHFAFNLINSLRHLHTDGDVLAHLDRVARSLVPGGVYAVGINTAAYGAEMETEDLWSGARGPCRVTQLIQFLPPTAEKRTETALCHLTIDTPTSETHLDSVYHLRSYSAREWTSLLARSAMTPIAIVDELGDPLPHEAGEPDADCWHTDTRSGYAIWLLTPR